VLAQDIRSRLSRYVSGESSLEQFEDWFLPAAWNLTPDPDGEAYDLASELWLRLAEYDNGDWSEEELRRFFRKLTKADAPGRASRAGS